MKNEEWININEYRGHYKISNYGRVKNTNTYNILKPALDNRGYLTVSLSIFSKKKTHKIHQLVAEYYVNNPNNYPEINHIDGNKANNCYLNLEWCTHLENMQHYHKFLKNNNKVDKLV